MINELANKGDKVLEKSQTPEDLLNAIKQVAKEMANAVKSGNKKTTPINTDELYKDKTVTTEYKEMKENSLVMDNDMTREDSEAYIPKGEIFFNRENQGNSNDFYERNIMSYNNLQHRLELERYHKIVKEMKECKSRPGLAIKSREIINNKFLIVICAMVCSFFGGFLLSTFHCNSEIENVQSEMSIFVFYEVCGPQKPSND